MVGCPYAESHPFFFQYHHPLCVSHSIGMTGTAVVIVTHVSECIAHDSDHDPSVALPLGSRPVSSLAYPLQWIALTSQRCSSRSINVGSTCVCSDLCLSYCTCGTMGH